MHLLNLNPLVVMCKRETAFCPNPSLQTGLQIAGPDFPEPFWWVELTEIRGGFVFVSFLNLRVIINRPHAVVPTGLTKQSTETNKAGLSLVWLVWGGGAATKDDLSSKC